MNGLIVIDKPSGFTSFDVVAVMRKLTHQKKIGHAGTLDPMATGVLPILLGNATKAQSILPSEDKAYMATFQLGIKTDSQDITGNIIEKKDFSVLYEKLENTLKLFLGEIDQIPPMYSAIKKNGVRLYTLARNGIEVEIEPRKVNIYSLKLIEFNSTTGEGKIDVHCSKGTYIRSLCNDIGNLLGCGATLKDLRRTKACGFDLNDSITLEKARELAENGTLDDFVIKTENLFKDYPAVTVTSAQATRFKNGGGLDLNRISLPSLDLNTPICVFDDISNFLGLGYINKQKNELSILKLFLPTT